VYGPISTPISTDDFIVLEFDTGVTMAQPLYPTILAENVAGNHWQMSFAHGFQSQS